ncbi:MAG: methyltransferase [Actinomadura sp.]
MPRRRDYTEQELRIHFEGHASSYDPATFRHIDMLGIQPGWRCWEVGAGGPSVPRWLAERVGPEGHVLATDLEVAPLQGPGEPYEVHRHDIAVDTPPVEGVGRGFDLVHARLLLVHVQQRDAALAAMVRALRPGGYLFVEDVDFELQPLAAPDVVGPVQELANKIRRSVQAISSDGRPQAYGRTLPRLLRAAGLVDVEADVHFSLASARLARYQHYMVEVRREYLLPSGLVTEEEFERHLADIEAGRVDMTTFPIVSAWARKPL